MSRTKRTAGLPPQRESDFQNAVIKLAILRGWRVHHVRPARTSKGWRTPVQGTAGFPDVVLVRDGRMLIVELKSVRGRVSSEQQAWLDALRAVAATTATIEVHVWRPRDWDAIAFALS